MTTTSAVPAVIDWLVSAAKSSQLLGSAALPVNVFDGPQPPAATQALERVLWFDADPASAGTVTSDAAQSWPVMDKGRTRDEDGTVTLAAQHWGGDPSVKAHRDGAYAILAGVELLLRGDGTTGPGDTTMGGLVFWSALDTYQGTPRQVANGVAYLVVATVVFRARLVTTGA